MSPPDRPPLAAPLDRENPYPGLHPFTEADAGFFFGRDEESGELLRLIRHETLTVLIGKSGLGKTSLLAAGVFPLLRQSDYLPILIRLGYHGSPEELEHQVRAAVASALTEARVDAPPPDAAQTLWEYFHQTRFWSAENQLLTPVLAFDQFEELFTLGRGDPRVRPFLATLAELVENRIPPSVLRRLEDGGEELGFSFVKSRLPVVLSLREDFLPHLEELREEMPSLARNRLRVRPMSEAQARTAVLGPGGELVTPEVAGEIVRFAADSGGGNGAGAVAAEDERLSVEPSLLSLVCRELNGKRRLRGLPEITSELVAETGDRIIADFYRHSFVDLGKGVRGFVEDELLTESGFRTSKPMEEALLRPGVSDRAIAALIDRRLLRSEERLGIPHLELIHDVLRDIVMTSRERRRRRQRRWRALGWATAAGLVVAALLAATFWYFLLHRRAAAERDRADQTVELLLTKVSNPLAQSGQFELLASILEDAERQLAGVGAAASHESDSGARNRSLVLNHLGDVYLEQGRSSEALEQYQGALAIARRRAEVEPRDPSRLDDLAIGYSKLAAALGRRDELGPAVEALETSLQLNRHLAELDPRRARWRRKVAVDLRALGDLETRQGKTEQALGRYTESRRISSSMQREDPRDSEARLDLAVIGERLGLFLLGADRPHDARTHLLESLALFDELLASDPGNDRWRTNRGILLRRLGEAARATGDDPQAREWSRQSVEVLDELAAAHPQSFDLRVNLAAALIDLSSLSAGAEAAAARDRSLLLLAPLAAEHPANSEVRLELERAARLAEQPPGVTG